ncbi:hypothetical protein L0F63_003274 [Massospora cicadina]|nr:hypothetical protein L0F63_003274 [Massospora cicadina]
MDSFFSANTPSYFVANAISAGCTVIVVSVAIWLRTRGGVNRASLMLQAGISLVDLGRHIRLFFNSSEHQFLFTAMAAFSFFGDHLSMLLNVAIAAKLHHIFLLGKTPGSLWRHMLWVSPIMAVMVLDSVPLLLGAYGKSHSEICFLKSDHKLRLFFKFYLFYASLYVGVIYCLVFSVLVYLKAITQTSSCVPLRPRGSSFGIYNRLVSQFAAMIALYPLSCFVSHFGLGLLLQSTAGIANLLCLFFDPSLSEWFRPTKAIPTVPTQTCAPTSTECDKRTSEFEISLRSNRSYLDPENQIQTVNLLLDQL